MYSLQKIWASICHNNRVCELVAVNISHCPKGHPVSVTTSMLHHQHTRTQVFIFPLEMSVVMVVVELESRTAAAAAAATLSINIEVKWKKINISILLSHRPTPTRTHTHTYILTGATIQSHNKTTHTCSPSVTQSQVYYTLCTRRTTYDARRCLLAHTRRRACASGRKALRIA